jgi:hypothetical protein
LGNEAVLATGVNAGEEVIVGALDPSWTAAP